MTEVIPKNLKTPVHCCYCFCQIGSSGEAVVGDHKAECYCRCHTVRWTFELECPDCDGEGFHQVDDASRSYLSHHMRSVECYRCGGEGVLESNTQEGVI